MSESMMCPCSSTSSTAGLLDRRAMTCLLRTDERGLPASIVGGLVGGIAAPCRCNADAVQKCAERCLSVPFSAEGVRQQNRPKATYCCLLRVVSAPVCPLSRRGATTDRRGTD